MNKFWSIITVLVLAIVAGILGNLSSVSTYTSNFLVKTTPTPTRIIMGSEVYNIPKEAVTLAANTPTPSPSPVKTPNEPKSLPCKLANLSFTNSVYIARFNQGERKGTNTECNLRCIVSKSAYTLFGGTGKSQETIDDTNPMVDEVIFDFYPDGRVTHEGFYCFRTQEGIFEWLMKNS